MLEEKPQERLSKIILADTVIERSAYESVHESASPLVAAVDYVIQKSKIENPRILEVGPVPTIHYKKHDFGIYDVYDPDFASKVNTNPQYKTSK